MPSTASRIRATAGGVLVAQQVAAEARLGPLGVFELHDGHALDRLFADAEQARGDLRDHVVVIGPHPLHVAALARAGEGVPGHGGAGLGELRHVADRAEGHAAAVPGDVDPDLRPAVVPAVQLEARVDLVLRHARPAASPGT